MEEVADVIVVGAGPGGYSVAIRLAQAGLRTFCIEKGEVGGVCLNWGCIPSKALISTAEHYDAIRGAEKFGIQVGGVELDMMRVATRTHSIVTHHTRSVASLLEHNGVRLIRGTARLQDASTVVVQMEGGQGVCRAEQAIVLATGARPRSLAGFEPDGVSIHSAQSAVFLERVPQHLIVLGGGVIGLELGSAYQMLGAQLTVVELGPKLLPGVDCDAVRVVRRQLEKAGAQVLTETRALESRSTSSGLEVVVQSRDGEKSTLFASDLLVATGFVPNTQGLGLQAIGVELDAAGHVVVDEKCRTKVPGIFALGDMIGPPYLAHRAYAHANVVAGAIEGDGSACDFRAMPAAVFTHPEVATVGLSEKEAKSRGGEIQVGRFPFSASGRAHARGQGEGFVKLVARNGYVVGATIVGAEASELIAEIALALETGTTLEDLALTVHAHPTLSEAVHDAADHALGRAVHIANRARR